MSNIVPTVPQGQTPPGGTTQPVTTAPTIPTVPAFGTQKRTTNEILAGRPQYDRTLRASSTLQEKLKIMEKATVGAITKLQSVDFESITAEGDNSKFENSLEVDSFLSNLESHFHRFDIIHFFSNFPVLEEPLNSESDRFRNGATIDLFSVWDQIGKGKLISATQIADTIQWIRAFSTDESVSYIEDLDWSHQYLLNSMEPELLETVHSTLRHEYSPEQQGGPLTLAIIIDEVVNLSDSAIDHMIETIHQYDIKAVEGENIDTVCRRFRYAFKRLENNNSLSSDLTRSLHKVFTSTSHERFNMYMNQWFCSIENGTVPTPSYQGILSKAKFHYSNFKCSGQWTSTEPTKSVFKTTANINKKPLKCHWCGDKNHIRPNCP